MAKLREDNTNDDDTVTRGIGAQTSNFYLQALKQFCRWMVRERRASESPLSHLQGLNVRTDRRHDRRALTVHELRRLLDAACNGVERFGMTGAERSLLYRVAVETGLRQGELRSLTRSCFMLDGKEPTVTVLASYAKNRREATLPMKLDTAAALLGHLASKLPSALAFNMPERRNVMRMLRPDLEAAGIAYRDDAGRVADFHALRHTFISNLAAGGCIRRWPRA